MNSFANLLPQLRLPVLGSPMFIASGPELVKAQCQAGIIGSFPTLNARPASMLTDWLDGNAAGLDEDLLWQPELWRALVERVDADPPHLRHQKTVARLRDEDRIALTYGVPVNGSTADIAGVLSGNRRTLGLMPHPERAADPALGAASGARLFAGLLDAIVPV